MNKWSELLVGLLLIILPIAFAMMSPLWGTAVLQFLMGGLIVLLVIVGILFLLLGISDIKG